MEKLLTTREVADILRMRIETITRKAERGLLPAIKVGGRWRIPEDRLEALLKSKETPPTADIPRRLEPPIIVKTFRSGGIIGSLSREEIYEDL